MKLGNVTFKDLPTLAEYKDPKTNRSKLCYNYCLSLCPHSACEYKKVGGRVDGLKLPEKFVKELCAKLKKGADMAFHTLEPPTKKARV